MKTEGVVLLLLVVFSASVVSAQAGNSSLVPDFIADSVFFDVFSDPAETNLLAEFLKLMLLLISIVVVYSLFTFTGFPREVWLRLVVSIILGVLLSFLITLSDITVALLSFQALTFGLIILFAAFLMFSLFSFSTRMNAFGIIFQKIAWIFVSVFLFALLLGYALVKLDKWDVFADTRFYMFLFGDTFAEVVHATEGLAVPIGLVVSFVVVLYVFVIKNDVLSEWFSKQTGKALAIRKRDEEARAARRTEIQAADTI